MANPGHYRRRTSRALARFGSLLFALVAIVPLAAAAQGDPSRRANTAQNAAVHEYEEGRYADALEHFQEVYRLTPESPLLLAIARCRYRLGQLQAAKSCLFDFLKEDPKSVYGSEAFELLTRIENESAKTPAQSKMISCLSPPEPKAITGVPVGGGAGPAAGTGAQGGGDAKTAMKTGHGPWSYIAFGASVVAAGVGGYFGTRNLSATSDWRAARTQDASASARDRARSAARSADIAWAASGVFLGTGLGLFFFTQF